MSVVQLAADPIQHMTPLWRYMKVSTFLMLLDGKAFFPSVATLRKGDPLEGEFAADHPRWLRAKWRAIYGSKTGTLESWLRSQADKLQADLLKRNSRDAITQTHVLAEVFLAELAKRRAVWCWHESDGESAAMWSLYGHAGVAVGTDAGTMTSCLPAKESFQLARIRYFDRAQRHSKNAFRAEASENQELIHRPHLLKGREYKHEQEIRLTVVCEIFQPGKLITGIDASKLVRKLVISPLLPFDEAQSIEAFLLRLPAFKSCEIRRSSILGDRARTDKTLADTIALYGDAKELGVPSTMREL